MPKVGMTHNGETPTRNAYTKVATLMQVSLDGKELPSLGVVGEALEAAIEVFNAKIKESYEVVPPRVDTPVAEPYAPKPTAPAVPVAGSPVDNPYDGA